VRHVVDRDLPQPRFGVAVGGNVVLVETVLAGVLAVLVEGQLLGEGDDVGVGRRYGRLAGPVPHVFVDRHDEVAAVVRGGVGRAVARDRARGLPRVDNGEEGGDVADVVQRRDDALRFEGGDPGQDLVGHVGDVISGEGRGVLLEGAGPGKDQVFDLDVGV